MPPAKGPEWDEVEVVAQRAAAGGNPTVKCKHCLIEFVGGATRIRAHYIGKTSGGVQACASVPDDLKARMEQREASLGASASNERVAMRVLSQVSSACACERNWSSYDFIHSKRRNRLTPARARDLVWVFTNVRLAAKMQSIASEEPFVGWDEAYLEPSDDEGVDGE